MGPQRDLAALLQSPEWAQGKPQPIMSGLADAMALLSQMQRRGPIEGRPGDEGIFKAPPDPFVRRNLDFDKMDPDWIYERGPGSTPRNPYQIKK
jgi:hypothetical protein